MKQSPRCGLLPLPIIGQPDIFRLIPSLARDSTPPAQLAHGARSDGTLHLYTRACFCSNIKKQDTFLSRIRTDIFTCHCDVLPLNYMSRWTQFRLLLVSFYGAGWESRTLISTSAKSHISRYVKPAISSIARWLLRTYLLLQQGILNHCCWSTRPDSNRQK